MSLYRLSSIVFVLFAGVLVAETADARSFRVNQIPNNDWSCTSCHESPRGGRPLSDFGTQVENNLAAPKQNADVDWQAIYDLDADGDGYTNGEELRDPTGDWSNGDADPAGTPSNPTDADDTLCGNGTVEGPEMCDGTNLDGETCSSLGFAGGSLACNTSCEFDDSQCTGEMADTGGTSDTGGMDAGDTGTTDTGGMSDTGTTDDTGTTSDGGDESDTGGTNDAGEQVDTGMVADAGADGGGDDGDDEIEVDDTPESGCSAAGDGRPVGMVLFGLVVIGAAGLRRRKHGVR